MSTYKYVKKLAYRKIAGETFIVNPNTRMLYQPAGVGERIFVEEGTELKWLTYGMKF